MNSHGQRDSCGPLDLMSHKETWTKLNNFFFLTYSQLYNLQPELRTELLAPLGLLDHEYQASL
jgi:hypothetical protein